jgi:thioredoxin 1
MASANVLELTTENWQKEVVESTVPVLVDFWAPWCAPCRALGPTIDKVADQFAGRAKVGKLNIDENQEIAIRYGISGIPQLFFFHGGDQPMSRFAGLKGEPELAKELNRLLGV